MLQLSYYKHVLTCHIPVQFFGFHLDGKHKVLIAPSNPVS